MAEGYMQCEGCNCLLKAEHGPLCATCQAERRSEAAKRGAATKAAEREEATEDEPA
jgi:hypothetical protein